MEVLCIPGSVFQVLLPEALLWYFSLSQDAGSQQIGFLLGSCGVSLALTSEVCLKGLPKTPNGEIMQFKGLQSCVLMNFYLSLSPDWC